MTDWKERASQKAQSVLDLIPNEWRLDSIPSASEQRDITGSYIQKFLTAREIEITETDALGIVAKTSSGAWTAVEVAKAFCHRAALAHQLVSCLHEIFFSAAIADAEKLDAYYAQHKKPLGVLHGLPVSLKDQFHVKGVESHIGYVGWLGTFEGRKGTGKERTFESEMVRELRSLGAVLYCKTSVPHSLMCGETVNNIIGYTQNSKNRNLTSGGSSGGEGALISARGSPIGFGTDIGGSIRIPAAFNGLYGLRPSTGRLPYGGMANTMDGQNSVLSVVGPLATTVDDLQFLTQAILSTQPWFQDPLVLEMPWRPDIESAVEASAPQLTFALMRHDGACHPYPPINRALSLVEAALKARGNQILDWNPTPTHPELCDMCLECWNHDAGSDIREALALSGETPSSHIVVADGSTPQATAREIMAFNVAKRDAQKKYMDYWNASADRTTNGKPVDCIICPLAAFPAARPGRFSYYAYSIWVNLVDYTSVTIPITTVDKNIDSRFENFQPFNDEDQKTQDNYDPDIYDGAYVGIQLVGRRLQEEKMLAIAKYVRDALRSQAVAA